MHYVLYVYPIVQLQYINEHMVLGHPVLGQWPRKVVGKLSGIYMII